jgi:hypothetical protein
LLTLYTTPVIYLAMDALRDRIVRALGGTTGFEPLPPGTEEAISLADRRAQEPVRP